MKSLISIHAEGNSLCLLCKLIIKSILFIVDINIAKFTQGVGSLKNAIHVSFFNDKISVPLSLRSAARDTTVSNNDGTSTSDYGAGTDDMSTFGMKMLRGMPEAVNMQPLLNNAADRTRPQILDLGDGRKFVVFIANRGTDSEPPANDMCLFYSICDENGNIDYKTKIRGTNHVIIFAQNRTGLKNIRIMVMAALVQTAMLPPWRTPRPTRSYFAAPKF